MFFQIKDLKTELKIEEVIPIFLRKWKDSCHNIFSSNMVDFVLDNISIGRY